MFSNKLKNSKGRFFYNKTIKKPKIIKENKEEKPINNPLERSKK